MSAVTHRPVPKPRTDPAPVALDSDVGKVLQKQMAKLLSLGGASEEKMLGFPVSCHDIAGICAAFFSRCQRYRCGQVTFPTWTGWGTTVLSIGSGTRLGTGRSR